MKKLIKLIPFLILVLLMLGSCGKGKRIGAMCEDGTRSSATGSGACSHHGGVDYWLYEK